MMLLSVVVPFYRGRSYLARTLAGLARQQMPRDQWEVIISEDGSPEPTDAIIERYSAINIRRVAIQRNGFRLATARNIAIEASSAPIIVLLDFDCVPLPNHLESHFRLLHTSPRTATVGLRRFVDLSDVRETTIRERDWWHSVEDIPSISSRGCAVDKRAAEIRNIASHPCPSNLFHGCNVGFWRADAQQVGFFSEQFNGAHGYEDLEFAWRLQQAGVRFLYAEATVFHQENSVISEAQRSKQNYAVLRRLAPGLAAFREAR